MGSSAAEGALFSSSIATPIAQLKPDLSEQSLCVVRAEVTVVWPYNSVNKTIAFLLAEPDILLRRARGLVRVQLSGSSAKAVAALHLGGGDRVDLSLDGAHWVEDTSKARARVDWQLQFAEKLRLDARVGDSNEIQSIHVDHPIPSTPPAGDEVIPDLPPQPGSPDVLPSVRQVQELDNEVFESPAFIKRARVSYGALFEDDDLELQEDGGVKGRGRKRTRFGRESNTWRYTSQSASPEPEAGEPQPPQDAPIPPSEQSNAPPRKYAMTDEGSQTVDLHLVSSQPEALPMGSAQSRSNREQMPPGGGQSWEWRSDPVVPQPQKEMLEEILPLPSSDSPDQFMSSSFAPIQDTYSVPRFGASGPSLMDNGLTIADQVRFSFSHEPQPQYDHGTGTGGAVDHAHVSGNQGQVYPETFLQPSDPEKYAGMETYVDSAEQEHEMERPQGHDAQQLPPIVDNFERGQWDVATQSLGYNNVEGGHFGTDALDEGYRITNGEDAIRSDEIGPDQVPPGFGSYGDIDKEASQEEAESDEGDSDKDPRRLPGADFVENSEVEEASEDEVGVEDEDDAEYDEDGDIIEQGDYDQRRYGRHSDDDEGLSDQDNEIMRETADKYGRLDAMEAQESSSEQGDLDVMTDEVSTDNEPDDHDQEYDSDDVDDQSEDEEHRTMFRHESSQRVPRPAGPKEPVVISLLSDSEDEDEVEPSPQASGDGVGSKASADQTLLPNYRLNEAHRDIERLYAASNKEKHDLGHSQHEPATQNWPEPDDRAMVFGQTHTTDFATERRDGSAMEIDQTLASHPTRAGEPSKDELEVVQMSENPIHDDAEDKPTHQGDPAALSEAIFKSATSSVEPQGGDEETESAVPVDLSEPRGSQRELDRPTIDEDLFGEDPTNPQASNNGNEDMIHSRQLFELSQLPLTSPSSQGFKSQVVETIIPTTSPSGTHIVSDETTIAQPTPLLAIQTETTTPSLLPQLNESELPPANGDNILTPDLSAQSDKVQTSPASKKEKAPRDIRQSDHRTEGREKSLDTESEVHDEVNLLPAKDAGTPQDKSDDQVQQLPSSPPPSDPVGGVETEHHDSRIQKTQVEGTASEPAEVDTVKTRTRSQRARGQNTAPKSKSIKMDTEMDPSVELARASLASKSGGGLKKRLDPIVKKPAEPTLRSPMRTRARSNSARLSTPDVEDASVVLAKAGLASPSRTSPRTNTATATAVPSLTKTALAKRLRTELPQYTVLHGLRGHLHKQLDVLAVVTTQPSTPTRQKSRQFAMSMHVTDPSTAPAHVVEVQFYRMHKDSLPTPRPGDAMVLRNFRVESLTGKGFGLRTHDESSYAVFGDSEEPEIRGPPIELDEEEKAYAAALRAWYQGLDDAARGKIQKANQKFLEMNHAK